MRRCILLAAVFGVVAGLGLGGVSAQDCPRCEPQKTFSDGKGPGALTVCLQDPPR